MPRTIHLDARAKKLLDHTDSDIIDRYRDYLLEDSDRHLWLSKTVLIDVDQIIRRRFVCDTHLCLKHRNQPNGKVKVKTKYSCCWDLEVQLLPTEIEAIDKHLPTVLERHPDVKKAVEKDGFWKYDSEWWKILSKKKNGSCVFLDHIDDLGMSACSLHSTALATGIDLPDIKPLICRMFPIFILETEDVNIVTFYSEETHRVLFDDDYERMECLHDNDLATDYVYLFMRGTLESLVGKDGYEKIAAHADKVFARDAKRSGNGR